MDESRAWRGRRQWPVAFWIRGKYLLAQSRFASMLQSELGGRWPRSPKAGPPRHLYQCPQSAMSDSSQRPTLLANLLLMLIVGAALFVFFAFIKGCGKKSGNTVAKEEPAKPAASDTKAEPPKPKLTPEEQAKAVAKANEVRPKSGPVSADPAERER